MIDPTTPIPDPLGLGAEAVAFIESLILEEGEPFLLVPEQRQIVLKIFGDVDGEGYRKLDVVYLHLPSGNAKSTLAAACMFLLLAHPKFRIPSGQIVIAAATRDQARKTSFGIIQGFIERMFPDESERALRFRIVSNAVSQEIHHLPSGSFLSVLSRSPGAQEGLKVYGLLAEETHVWGEQANRLWDVLRKSQSKIKGTTPLAMIATTAGVGVGGIGRRLYETSREIALGNLDNPGWLPVIYEMSPDDDWRDPAVWKRLNFAIPSFKSMRFLKSLCREAEASLSAKAEFLRYHLNFWAAGVGDPWIDISTYDEAAEPFAIEDIAHLPVYVGCDAGQTSDLTAVVALFHDVEAKRFYAVPHIWCPAESIARRSQEDSVPYDQWEAEGLITATEGSAIDEDAIETCIRDLCETYDVQRIGFDPYHTRRMMARLADDGLPVVEVAQHYRLMSPAMKNTERAILERRLRHGGHEALRWAFANVVMPVPDPNGNIKPSKKHSRNLKIDPAVATMIAMALATVADEEAIYDFEALTGRPNEELPNGR